MHTRGELQLSLLIEGMRRERFEMEISAPQVLLKREGGHFLEPLEEVWLDVPEFSVGVLQFVSGRNNHWWLEQTN